jgi:hypothetical protein
MNNLFEQWYAKGFPDLPNELDQKGKLAAAFLAGQAARPPLTLNEITARLRQVFRQAEETDRLQDLLQTVEQDPDSLLHRANTFLADLLRAYQCRYCHSQHPKFHLHDCPIKFEEILRLPALAPHPAEAEVTRLQACTQALRDKTLEAAAAIAAAGGDAGPQIAVRILALKRSPDFTSNPC